MRHSPLKEQADHLNRMLRGHDAYYGIAGNLRSLLKVHRAAERYWRKMLSSRSWHGEVSCRRKSARRSRDLSVPKPNPKVAFLIASAYLLKENGVWQVDHDHAFTLVTCNG